jgi:hypothetical protein
MAQRSLVTLLAALGGILIVLGGLLGALLSFAPARYGMPFPGVWNAVVLGILAVVFGLVILAYSGATHWAGVQRNLVGGVVLIVLGLVTWVVVGGWLLVAVGSFLTVVAGIIVLAEQVLSGARLTIDHPT